MPDFSLLELGNQPVIDTHAPLPVNLLLAVLVLLFPSSFQYMWICMADFYGCSLEKSVSLESTDDEEQLARVSQ